MTDGGGNVPGSPQDPYLDPNLLLGKNLKPDTNVTMRTSPWHFKQLRLDVSRKATLEELEILYRRGDTG